jgi:hypothetical protein
MKGLEDEADTRARSAARAASSSRTMSSACGADADRAAVGGFEAGDAVQQGALANAGFADQGDDFAGRDGERQACFSAPRFSAQALIAARWASQRPGSRAAAQSALACSANAGGASSAAAAKISSAFM